MLGYTSLAYLCWRAVYSLLLSPSTWSPEDKHCYITGGSQGLGKSMAIQLARKGAHVTIVARKEQLLKDALVEIKAACKDPSRQKIAYAVADVSVNGDCVRALKEATTKIGKVPEYVFCIAGFAQLQFLHDLDDSVFERLIKVNYLGAVYTVKEASRLMIEKNVKNGKLVLCSSLAAFVSFVGYSAYSPTKYALKGLADCLRQEMQMHGIGVHILFPGSIATAGFEEENKLKPRITKEIEGSDAMTPDAVAKASIAGLARGDFYITCEILGDLLQAGSLGLSPSSNLLVHCACVALSFVAYPILRIYTDSMTRREGVRLKRASLAETASAKTQ